MLHALTLVMQQFAAKRRFGATLLRDITLDFIQFRDLDEREVVSLAICAYL